LFVGSELLEGGVEALQQDYKEESGGAPAGVYHEDDKQLPEVFLEGLHHIIVFRFMFIRVIVVQSNYFFVRGAILRDILRAGKFITRTEGLRV